MPRMCRRLTAFVFLAWVRMEVAEGSTRGESRDTEESFDWLLAHEHKDSLDWLVTSSSGVVGGATATSPVLETAGPLRTGNDGLGLEWLLQGPQSAGDGQHEQNDDEQSDDEQSYDAFSGDAESDLGSDGSGDKLDGDKWLQNRQNVEYESRRGKYDRQVVADASGKKNAKKGRRLQHAHYAWLHFEQANNFSLGNPCLKTCPFHRQCGKHFTGAVLLRAHAFVYGDKEPERVTEPDGSVKYSCSVSASFTQCQWRRVVLASISKDATNPHVPVERFLVEGIGPVCDEYARRAYGVHSWTWKTLLAAARSFSLDVDKEPKACTVERQASPPPSTHPFHAWTAAPSLRALCDRPSPCNPHTRRPLRKRTQSRGGFGG